MFRGRRGGETKWRRGEGRLKKLPADGIFVWQFPATAGFTDRKYFSVDPGGKRTALEMFKFDHNSDGTVRWLVDDTTRKGIFLDGTSGQYGSDGDARAVQFDEFVVSSKEMLDSFFKKEYLRAFDDRIEKVTGLRFN